MPLLGRENRAAPRSAVPPACSGFSGAERSPRSRGGSAEIRRAGGSERRPAGSGPDCARPRRGLPLPAGKPPWLKASACCRVLSSSFPSRNKKLKINGVGFGRVFVSAVRWWRCRRRPQLAIAAVVRESGAAAAVHCLRRCVRTVACPGRCSACSVL